MSEEMEEMSEGTYEFIYRIRVVWNRETDSFDYYYVPIARPVEHDEEESKLIAVTMARIESAIYWGGLGKLCEETEVEEDE